MVSLIDINNVIKDPTCGYENYTTIQILIFGGYVKMRELFGSIPFLPY